jgi:Ca2+-binding RTX toxin-like protein
MVKIPVDPWALRALQSIVPNDNWPEFTSYGGADVISLSVQENTPLVIHVTATDADPGDTLGFSVFNGRFYADTNIFFSIVGTGPGTADVIFSGADYESPVNFVQYPFVGPNVYANQVLVLDSIGYAPIGNPFFHGDSQTFEITVTNQPGVTINGTSGSDWVTATQTVPGQPFPTDEEDIINGFADNDTLAGLGGNDIIDGGADSDTMIGGDGNDTYYVDTAGDLTIEAVGGGFDTVVVTTGITYALAAGSEVEEMRAASPNSTAVTNLVGNAFVNALYGNAAANLLNGGAGADTMSGYGGNDTYYVDDVVDRVIEAVGGGRDTVLVAPGTLYTLTAGAEVEVMATTNAASTTGVTVTGNEFNNEIYGDAGNDILDGWTGADILAGGRGNDTYYVDNVADRVIETVGSGDDEVIVVMTGTTSYTLAAGAEIETLAAYFPGPVAADVGVHLTGNEFANTVFGNYMDDVLDGGRGADRLSGFRGDDTYIIDNVGDQVIESTGYGFDTVVVTAAITYTLAADAEVEVMRAGSPTSTAVTNLVGNALANALHGNAAANLLNGGAGADTMSGYAGNDTYYVDNAGDQVIEAAGGGRDTVLVSAGTSYTLTSGAEVEVMATTNSASTAAVNLAGNAFANEIYGNAGSNIIAGGFGNDMLTGYGGADTFVFNTALGQANIDRITDFSVRNDTIQLDHTVFAGLSSGALAAAAFHFGASATDADDRIIYNSASGALFFDADGVGGATQVQFATLSAQLMLTQNDFFVV